MEISPTNSRIKLAISDGALVNSHQCIIDLGITGSAVSAPGIEGILIFKRHKPDCDWRMLVVVIWQSQL